MQKNNCCEIIKYPLICFSFLRIYSNKIILMDHLRQQDDVLTCSSFVVRGSSCVLLVISSKIWSSSLATAGSKLSSGLSGPGTRPDPSTSRQLLSAEADRGAKSELKESLGCSGGDTEAEVGRKDPSRSGDGLRITPALVLLGIHWARKSAWEYCSPAGDDMSVEAFQTIRGC